MKPEILSIKKVCKQWGINNIGDIIPFLTKESVMEVKEIPKNYPAGTKNSTLKVAWYLKNGWKKPVNADLGCPSFRDCPWPIEGDSDNHKFAAAFIRGDTSIEADVSGEVDWIKSFKA